MNLKVWFGRMFNDNRTEEGLNNVRTVGREDGVTITNSYADGFLEGVSDVLNARLTGFHHIEADAAPPVKRIASKKK